MGAQTRRSPSNVIFDAGNHADLVIGSPAGFTSTVVCRDNYHPDGTRLLPRDRDLKIIQSGLIDLPLEAGRNVTLTPANGRLRIDAGTAVEFGGLRLAHAVDPSGPARDHHFAGKPGDYAVQADFLYIYAGDGKTHRWKRVMMSDY